MGGFSIWHWIIVLFFFCSIAAVISLIVWVAKRASRKSPIATTGSAVPKTAQSRLLELDTLRSQQLITDAEYHQRRTHILSDI
ncbi:twin-arginine translocase TatA/TatE family subunit [Xanthomonas hortorum pv. vitians]|uniref:SHOCT domain-containing protein n=1 Tax=Xanthomonas hortorum pv. vitians TaxID=83224 RepID=A0A6V7CR98_9XANT|nr:twin-arginine translocase TatA/TatE family subunit [Xanthomonas hortorum]APP83609.1 hypothetical protein BI317_04865 [Xanthomonas hortorum pv. gardneri]ASW46484.1 hypothetical protein XJ27_11335 [Xanthomonas hortorum]MCC8496353.1 hypothetical protein [Xanthomonas hortorum pv. gardneri]MCE4281394.1 hypothetical protein [Xanthomonas hortorum pv. vitians]MCE4286176.1 hypothetical protein [Xanthomonas hortorum pv. vitians]